MSYFPSSSTHGTSPAYNERSSNRTSRQARRSSRSTSPLSPSAYMVGTLPPLPPASSSAPLTPAVPMPPQPQQAHDPIRVQYDEISAMFGGPRPSESSARSQTTRMSGRSRGASTIPPPYDSQSELESLPSYTKESDYDYELNRKLFLYGFRECCVHLTSSASRLKPFVVFPPLWIVGIITPFVKPHRDPAKDNRSKEAQDEEDSNMRTLEMRWARRCAIALITFIVLVVVAVVLGVSLSKK